MKPIYKIDIVFIGLNSSIILFTGIITSLVFKKVFFLLIALSMAVEIFYLFLTLKKPFLRFKLVKEPFPTGWREILTRQSVFYRNLDAGGRDRLEKNARIIISEIPIDGIRGKTIAIDTRVSIAMWLAVVIHGQPYWELPVRDGIVVYPGETFNRQYVIGRGNREGQATTNSPLIVTEKSIEKTALFPGEGHNIIYHELAHYFDMEDGHVDGVPSARLSPGKVGHWKTVIHNEWKKAIKGESILGLYAGTNEAETLATAVEMFFDSPSRLKKANSALYSILQDFFNIDPASILQDMSAIAGKRV